MQLQNFPLCKDADIYHLFNNHACKDANTVNSINFYFNEFAFLTSSKAQLGSQISSHYYRSDILHCIALLHLNYPSKYFRYKILNIFSINVLYLFSLNSFRATIVTKAAVNRPQLIFEVPLWSSCVSNKVSKYITFSRTADHTIYLKISEIIYYSIKFFKRFTQTQSQINVTTMR